LGVIVRSQAETHCPPDPLALWLFSINIGEKYVVHIQCLDIYDSEDGNTACHIPMDSIAFDKRISPLKYHVGTTRWWFQC